MQQFAPLLETFGKQSIVVLGDVFLDEYLIGRAERLSREAPVPVLEFRARRFVPGGGANPAMNAAALGASVFQIGIVGDDPEAASLRQLLVEARIDVSCLINVPGRFTVTKTRIMAEGELRFPQQLARIDRLNHWPLDAETEGRVIDAVRRLTLTADVSALLVSDYRSGLVTDAVAEAARAVARERGLLLTADTQGELGKYTRFNLVKCNRAEAESFLGRALTNDTEVAGALIELGARLEVRHILITRGAQGISIGVRGEGCVHLPAANVSEVYDVTGAGDTVIAVATLALAAGADPVMAARLANAAAGLVVRRWGNAVVTPAELGAEMARLGNNG